MSTTQHPVSADALALQRLYHWERTAPGRTNPEGTINPAIICLKDGEEVTVTGGPEAAGDLQWWKVKTKLGEGWAAEDYLSKKQ